MCCGSVPSTKLLAAHALAVANVFHWPFLRHMLRHVLRRDACRPAPTTALQQALAIAYMYLAQEVEQSYAKVRCFGLVAAPSEEGDVSKGGAACVDHSRGALALHANEV